MKDSISIDELQYGKEAAAKLDAARKELHSVAEKYKDLLTELEIFDKLYICTYELPRLVFIPHKDTPSNIREELIAVMDKYFGNELTQEIPKDNSK
jgi:hypothetical protein